MEQHLIVDFGFRFGDENFQSLLSGMTVGNESQRELFLEFAQSSIGLMDRVDMGASIDVVKRRNSKMLKAAKAFQRELEQPYAEELADMGGWRKFDDLKNLIDQVVRTADRRDKELGKGGRPITKGFYVLEMLAGDYRRAFGKVPSAAPSGHFFRIAAQIDSLHPEMKLPVNTGSIKKILKQQAADDSLRSDIKTGEK